uniref:GB1/RHD3-type G domain-containing protein n=1 Tax=Oryctolagus cuniculus TaxID=9986 RepID=A0A5F9CE06_RABIT
MCICPPEPLEMTAGSHIPLSGFSGLQVTMATDITMKTPICLVENWEEKLTVNPKALEILNQISQPVVVVAIVGLYRTGKSYLMNRLAGQNHGFPLGSTVQSQTKGIWMWCVPHPSKPNHTLVLLDTEGLGDVEKGDPKNDSWIFALAVLLSSAFVYNSLGTINHQALEQLHFVTELTELIRARSSPPSDEVEDSAEFVSFFPDFVWAVRDFTLELNLKGQPITEDEYLENALKLIPGLGSLVEMYVDTINSGAVPCLENAVTTLAQRENAAAVQKAAEHYSRQMAQRLVLPTDTLQELLDVHAACEREAVEIFMEHSFKDDTGEFQKNLLETTEQKKEDFLLQNEEASVKYCQAELTRLSASLMESISRGVFSAPEGHRLYLEARKRIEEEYELVPRKGVKATEVLQTFLQSQAAAENSILQADKALTAGEKALAAEEAKREAAEKEREVLRQGEQEMQQKMEAQERSFQENIAQLKEKMEREREDLLREQERMLEHKLKATEVLQTFLQSQTATENSILQADKALTDAEKALAAGEAKREAAEKEREVLRQREQEMQQKMEAQERSFQENIAQLKEKMEREREDLLREQERMLEHKLKATEVLQTFLQSQAAAENSILQADKALTDAEKALAAGEAKREAAEKEREVLRQREQEMQQKMEAQERSFQENIAQLKEKMEREREDLLREQERMLEHKLKVQKDMLTEGFNKEADMLHKEINRITEDMAAIKNQEGWSSAILSFVGGIFGSVLGRLSKAGISRLLRLSRRIL